MTCRTNVAIMPARNIPEVVPMLSSASHERVSRTLVTSNSCDCKLSMVCVAHARGDVVVRRMGETRPLDGCRFRRTQNSGTHCAVFPHKKFQWVPEQKDLRCVSDQYHRCGPLLVSPLRRCAFETGAQLFQVHSWGSEECS